MHLKKNLVWPITLLTGYSIDNVNPLVTKVILDGEIMFFTYFGLNVRLFESGEK